MNVSIQGLKSTKRLPNMHDVENGHNDIMKRDTKKWFLG